jgi:hypothetical protein
MLTDYLGLARPHHPAKNHVLAQTGLGRLGHRKHDCSFVFIRRQRERSRWNHRQEKLFRTSIRASMWLLASRAGNGQAKTVTAASRVTAPPKRILCLPWWGRRFRLPVDGI